MSNPKPPVRISRADAVKVSTRLPENLLADLRTEARLRNCPVAALINSAVLEWLRRQGGAYQAPRTNEPPKN